MILLLSLIPFSHSYKSCAFLGPTHKSYCNICVISLVYITLKHNYVIHLFDLVFMLYLPKHKLPFEVKCLEPWHLSVPFSTWDDALHPVEARSWLLRMPSEWKMWQSSNTLRAPSLAGTKLVAHGTLFIFCLCSTDSDFVVVFLQWVKTFHNKNVRCCRAEIEKCYLCIWIKGKK